MNINEFNQEYLRKINTKKKTFNDLRWEGSPNEPIKKLSNQQKGSFGCYLIEKVLSERGKVVTVENKNAVDLSVVGESLEKVEVKTAFAKYNKGSWALSWFNQVRPQSPDWEWLYLVDVHPDFVRILRLNRYSGGLDDLMTGHVTGAEDSSELLLEVKLKNKPKHRLESVDSWDLVWDSRENTNETERS